MAKKFTFKQVAWNRATVNWHKRFFCSGTMIMDISCHQFFTRSGFTPDEYVNVRVREIFYARTYTLHAFTVPIYLNGGGLTL